MYYWLRLCLLLLFVLLLCCCFFWHYRASRSTRRAQQQRGIETRNNTVRHTLTHARTHEHWPTINSCTCTLLHIFRQSEREWVCVCVCVEMVSLCGSPTYSRSHWDRSHARRTLAFLLAEYLFLFHSLFVCVCCVHAVPKCPFKTNQKA